MDSKLENRIIISVKTSIEKLKEDIKGALFTELTGTITDLKAEISSDIQSALSKAEESFKKSFNSIKRESLQRQLSSRRTDLIYATFLNIRNNL